jgi:hypothetical protein
MKHNFRGFLLTLAMMMAPLYAQAQSFEIYAGSTLGGQNLNYGPAPSGPPNLQQMNAGPVFGAGIYTGFGTFEVGLDVMSTSQDYTTWGPGSTLDSLSLMANGRLIFAGPIANSASYFGVGVGSIALTYDDPAAFLDGSDTISGWQAEAGIRVQLGPVEGFTALKYQAGFNEATIQLESVEYNSTSVLVGVRF